MSKHNRFIPRGKPQYRQSPEAAMAKEYAGFTPWKVDCLVYHGLLDAEGTRLTAFCRAPDPSKAMHAARLLWGRRIKERHLRPGQQIPEWPKMDDRHEVECLDDSDYMQAWKAACSQDLPRFWIGELENPLAYTFFPDTTSGLIA